MQAIKKHNKVFNKEISQEGSNEVRIKKLEKLRQKGELDS